MPHVNETFFLDVPAGYARHCGADVSYSQSSGFYYGRPTFVIARVGVNVMANAARRNAAARQAAAQWREHQPCRLVISNQRLLCQVDGRWLSFYFSAVTAVHPESENWSLITRYDSTSPLLLSGEHVPAAALLTVLATQGLKAVSAHPSLQKLGAIDVRKLNQSRALTIYWTLRPYSEMSYALFDTQVRKTGDYTHAIKARSRH